MTSHAHTLLICITVIRYILNYLRNGELLCPNDKTIQKELLKEAMFFQIQGIIDQLKGNISPFEGSLILTKESHRAVLMSWLPPNSTCSLLYRASTDGKTPADFHRCCDNKGPTLVVIKSGGYIFGGYTSQSWESGLHIIHCKTRTINPTNTFFLFLHIITLSFDWLTVLSVSVP